MAQRRFRPYLGRRESWPNHAERGGEGKLRACRQQGEGVRRKSKGRLTQAVPRLGKRPAPELRQGRQPAVRFSPGRRDIRSGDHTPLASAHRAGAILIRIAVLNLLLAHATNRIGGSFAASHCGGSNDHGTASHNGDQHQPQAAHSPTAGHK